MKQHNPDQTPLECECRKCTILADIVGTYMEANIKDHIDVFTDEVLLTELAEDAAHNFDLYDGDVPKEWLFDLAVQVAEIYELQRE